jgi:hypothetical protein
MALNANNIGNGGGSKVAQPDIEAGVYPARIVQVLDLGLQPQRAYQGKDKPPANEVMITYELVDTFLVDEDGNELEDKPRWVSETFPLNPLYADKAKSTQRYKAVDPNENFGGDFSLLVDSPVNVTIVLNQKGDKTYTNVAGIAGMRPRDAQKCPELKNPTKVFDLSAPDMEVFNSLPQWVQDKIKGNLEFNGSPLQAKLEGKAPKKEEPKKKPKPEPVVEDEIGEDDKPWDY